MGNMEMAQIVQIVQLTLILEDGALKSPPLHNALPVPEAKQQGAGLGKLPVQIIMALVIMAVMLVQLTMAVMAVQFIMAIMLVQLIMAVGVLMGKMEMDEFVETVQLTHILEDGAIVLPTLQTAFLVLRAKQQGAGLDKLTVQTIMVLVIMTAMVVLVLLMLGPKALNVKMGSLEMEIYVKIVQLTHFLNDGIGTSTMIKNATLVARTKQQGPILGKHLAVSWNFNLNCCCKAWVDKNAIGNRSLSPPRHQRLKGQFNPILGYFNQFHTNVLL